MPYPPPPGPPDVGEFQAIGKLPAPELPDVTGHGGEFLETDGIIPQWQPVSGVLPDPAGHAGEFLTTPDGVTVSWAPGGGGGVTTVGALTTANADAAIITGVTLQLAPADQTHPGVLTTAQQDIGGVKLFKDGAVTRADDIRNFGAVSIVNPLDPTTVTSDSTQAIKDALAAGQISLLGGDAFSAYVPVGNFAVSTPILIPNLATLEGAGEFASCIFVGPGTPATPSQVQGFSGPMFYVTAESPTSPPAYPFFPLYQAPLVGVTGQAMQYGPATALSGNTFPPQNLWLHDSYAWCTWLTTGVSNFCLQFWVSIDSLSAGPSLTPMISSVGPFMPAVPSDSAFSVSLFSNGSASGIEITFTTTTGIYNFQTAAVISAGNTYNIELDYDGSHIDVFINGTSESHVVATGTIVRRGWEGTCIGLSGTENSGASDIRFQGALDSIRLSNVARHTGTGSFTPPTSKYTWDANTMALINFDKPSVLNQPFVIAEAVLAGPQAAGPNPHYIRVGHGWNFVFNSFVSNLFLDCVGSTSGIIFKAGARCFVENVFINSPAQYGCNAVDGNSFYDSFENVYVYNGAGTGMAVHGVVNNCTTQFCSVGIQLTQGMLTNHNDNPSPANAYIPMVFGPGDPNFGSVYVRGNGNDNEGYFPLERCGVFVFGNQNHSYTFVSNSWMSLGSNKPVFIYNGTPAAVEGYVEHINDAFYGDGGAVIISNETLSPTPPISLEDCTKFTATPAAWTDAEGFVVQRTPGRNNNYVGISTTDTFANNIAGTFTILNGHTSGGPTFLVPEPDADYIVSISYQGYNGSAPAAGSTTVGPYTTSTTGFVMDQGTDPATDSMTIWSYVIIRTHVNPDFYSYLPAIPSTSTNPLAGETLRNAYMGVTVVPATGTALRYASDLGVQQLVEIGDGTSGSNFWGLSIYNGSQVGPELSTAGPNATDSFVAYNTGKLCGLANPGPHNIVYASELFNSVARQVRVYIDGGLDTLNQVGFTAPVVQPTPLYIGERYDTTEALTVATIRTVKIDTTFAAVVTTEPDAGPQPGNQVAAFFGDQMTIGRDATSGGTGGFATQIAENRYGTIYYYLAAYSGAYMTNGGLQPGVLDAFWVPWGNLQPSLQGICLLAGFNDILHGVSAADVQAEIALMLTGVPATGTYTPTVHFNSAPPNVPNWPIFDAQAWAEAYGFSPSNPTFTIAGVTFTATWNTDAETTAGDLAALINANGTTSPLVTASAQYDSSHNTWFCLITANASGTAGNGITTTTDGAGGAAWFPGGTTQFGADFTCIIEGVTFNANFDTDAATTCNNLIARINLSGPTLALVTPSNVGNKLVVTAVTAGAAGNAITTGGGGGSAGWTETHLLGGADGAVQKAIPTIVVCTVPPFGDDPGYTAGKETERNTLNTYIRGITGAGIAIADVDVTLRNPADHTKIDPTLLGGDNLNPNDAGHAALYTLINPLLP